MKAKHINELDKMMSTKEDTIPKGWYTRHQVALAYGRSNEQTDKVLSKLIKANLVERKMFNSRTNSGVRPTPYFFFRVASVSKAKSSRAKARR